MTKKRKLWRVVTADQTWSPESQSKAYGIYLSNELASWRLREPSERRRTRQVTILVDERCGYGFQRYEEIDLYYHDQVMKAAGR